MRSVLLVLRILLGALLLYSGIAKLRQPYDFLSNVYAYDLVGPTAGVLLAAALPWLELVIGGCLMMGILSDGAFLGGMALMALFTIAVASAWLRGLAISCGCFGHSSDTISLQTVIRAVALLALSLMGFVLCRRDAHCKSTSTDRKSFSANDPTRGGSLMAGPAADRPRMGRVFGRA